MTYRLTALVIAVVTFCSGCLTGISPTKRNVILYKDAWYSTNGLACAYSQLTDHSRSGISSRPELVDWLMQLGLTKSEAESECNDPFIVETLPFAAFRSIKPAKEIASYYESQFIAAGWQFKRGLLHLEYTNGGGDWLRVYARSGSEVLVHIVGRWENDETSENIGSLSGRTVIFKLRNCDYDAVFGRDALDKSRRESEYGSTH